MIRSEFRCDVWYSTWPIRCMLHVGHLGMHDTIDDAQFKHVEAFQDVIAFKWPNKADAMFGEMNDWYVQAGMRRELGGRSFDTMREIRNGANFFAPDHWYGYDAGTGDNHWYWQERRDNAAFWSAMLSRSKDAMILTVTLDN